MNKEITIYELLGLIKDGQAPKKIKYRNKIYEYKSIPEGEGYTYSTDNCTYWLSNIIDCDDKDALNDKVEIIEEDNKIEKLRFSGDGHTDYVSVIPKINELIDEVNKLKGDK